MVKKFVTIFAAHLDSFIVTHNLSLIYQLRDSGSGQIRNTGTNYLSPGLAKIAPWWLARRNNFPAKGTGTRIGGQRRQRFQLIPAGRQTV